VHVRASGGVADDIALLLHELAKKTVR